MDIKIIYKCTQYYNTHRYLHTRISRCIYPHIYTPLHNNTQTYLKFANVFCLRLVIHFYLYQSFCFLCILIFYICILIFHSEVKKVFYIRFFINVSQANVAMALVVFEDQKIALEKTANIWSPTEQQKTCQTMLTFRWLQNGSGLVWDIIWSLWW